MLLTKRLTVSRSIWRHFFANELRLVRISPQPYAYWNLKVPNLPTQKMADGNPRVWGTAWSYRGSNASFFSADDAEAVFDGISVGVWALPHEHINLKTKEAAANRVGAASTTAWNDGISCGTKTEKKQDACSYKMYRSTTQNVDNKGGTAKSAIKVLHEDTGAVSDQGGWDVDEEGLLGINACAINPVDNIIYCHMQFSDGAWIARLDHKTVGYPMKVEQWAIAGVFDHAGNYWFYYSGDQGLHMVGKKQKLNTYYAYPVRTKQDQDVNLNQKTDTTMSNSKIFANEMGADLALYVEEVEVEGLPSKKVYLVSILADCASDHQDQEFQSRVSFVEITGGNAQKAKILKTSELNKEKTNGGLPHPLPVEETPPNQDKGCQTWGSAWNLRLGNGNEQITFAADSGQGLFALDPDSINWECTTAPCVKFTPVGEAEPISWNNGFSCRSEDPSSVVIGKPN